MGQDAGAHIEDVALTPSRRRGAHVRPDVASTVRLPEVRQRALTEADRRHDGEGLRLEGLPQKLHAGLLGRAAPLTIVARVTRGEDVLPARPATANAGHDVVVVQPLGLLV